MLRLNRFLIAGLLGAFPMPAMPLRAAEPPQLGGPLAVEPVAPPALVLVPVDPRTGRCRAGFARNALGACVRHDEPKIGCDTPASIPGACFVAAPSLTPYGLGPSLRLNY